MSGDRLRPPLFLLRESGANWIYRYIEPHDRVAMSLSAACLPPSPPPCLSTFGSNCFAPLFSVFGASDPPSPPFFLNVSFCPFHPTQVHLGRVGGRHSLGGLKCCIQKTDFFTKFPQFPIAGLAKHGQCSCCLALRDNFLLATCF